MTDPEYRIAQINIARDNFFDFTKKLISETKEADILNFSLSEIMFNYFGMDFLLRCDRNGFSGTLMIKTFRVFKDEKKIPGEYTIDEIGDFEIEGWFDNKSNKLMVNARPGYFRNQTKQVGFTIDQLETFSKKYLDSFYGYLKIRFPASTR